MTVFIRAETDDGHVYTNHGKLNLFNARYELDDRPIEEGCQCPRAEVIAEPISVIS